MITNHQGSDDSSPPPVARAPSADPRRSDINAASDITVFFQNDTPRAA